MSKKSLALVQGKALFESVLSIAGNFPVSFTYGGTPYRTLAGLPCIARELSAGRLTAVYRVDEALLVRIDAKYNEEYGQSEYTVFFENDSSAPSKILTGVAALDHVFEGGEPVLRGILGDHQNYYAPYETDLSRQDAYHESNGGRATHVAFPYFNLVHGDGGTLIALGWAGTWNALYSKTCAGARAVIRSNPRLNTVLLPGEAVTTGLVVLLPYSGRDADDAMNLWREWFIRCSMPRANASGEEIRPFSTAFFAYDTGLPNSDGSISERSFTWKPSMEKVLSEGLRPDFRWFDAGWYFDPAGNTVESDWWGTVGSWELDTVKWPGKTFRESVDEFHRHGIKTFVWFEPERVTHVDDLVKNHGYKREWAIEAGGSVTNNIGEPECLEWTANRVIRMLDDNNVDLYREDNNANHNATWHKLDRERSSELGLPRYGIAENDSIVGHYRLWDRILNYCRRTGKCTFVDSCASGGGRNDIESLRRGVPFMRSDADRTTTALRLSMSASFNQWIPFHGAATKETEGQVDPSIGPGSDGYVYRASYLPVFNYSEAYLHNPELDFDRMRRYVGEWESIRHLLTKDMYVLTPWHARDNRTGWTAFAYDAPESGESLLLAFRMEDCEEERCSVTLPFAEPTAQYELTDADAGEKQVICGESLRNGAFTLTLPEKRSCLMLRIRRI